SLVGEGAGRCIEVVGVDAGGDGVVEVHGPCVRRPGGPVGHGESLVVAGAASIRVEAIERTGGRLAGEVHGAAPEAALRVAFAVVEAIGGEFGLRLVKVLGLRIGRSRVEEGEASAKGD